MENDFLSARRSLEYAQKRMAEHANLHHREEQFVVGDKVLLRVGKGKQLYSNLPGHSEHPKLLAKFVGPFSVKEKVSNLAYRLELRAHFKPQNISKRVSR